mgnify:FL=1|jgi:lysM domain protein
MRKVVATVVTCGLIGMSFISSPMSVEAVSSVSVESKDGNYSTMGFGGTFYEMEEAVNERLSEGPDNPIWFIASENCHTEAEYHFSTDKEKKDLAWEYNWVESDSKTDFVQVGTYMDNRLRANLEEAFKTDPQKAVKDVLSSAEEEFTVEIDSAQPIYWHTEDVNTDKFLLEVAVGKYVIEPGDCLSVLAERFGTTVEQLMADNQNITNPDLIYAGDFLVVK